VVICWVATAIRLPAIRCCKQAHFSGVWCTHWLLYAACRTLSVLRPKLPLITLLLANEFVVGFYEATDTSTRGCRTNSIQSIPVAPIV
jgi:hypothetical protein